MSAETVLQNVLFEIGLDRTELQMTSDDFEIKQIVGFMNTAGHDIAARADWSELLRAVQTQSGETAQMALPQDFARLASKSAVSLNKPGWKPLRPIAASEQWAFLQKSPSGQPFYRIKGNVIEFSPALDADGATIRYLSKNWVSGTKDFIEQNGDTLAIPEHLVTKGTIWRWKRQKGLPFDDILAEFEADFITAIRADKGTD